MLSTRIRTAEQQRVAAGPGNAHFISIRQVSSDAATLRRGRCGQGIGPPLLAALLLLPPPPLLCIDNSIIKN